MGFEELDILSSLGIPLENSSPFIMALIAMCFVQFIYTTYLRIQLNYALAEVEKFNNPPPVAEQEEDEQEEQKSSQESATSESTKLSYKTPVSAAKLLDFLLIVGNLKKQKRTGWVDNCVQDAESVADHMYRMGLLSFVIQDPKIDRTKLTMVGLVHDLAEAIVGDITPTEFSGVSKEKKHQMEVDALEKISSLFSDLPERQTEIEKLWWEYEASTPSIEGRIVKQFDKFEMIIQAYEYEKDQRVLLDSFFNSTAKSFTHPEMVSLHQELLQRRANLHQEWKREESEKQIPFPENRRRK